MVSRRSCVSFGVLSASHLGESRSVNMEARTAGEYENVIRGLSPSVAAWGRLFF